MAYSKEFEAALEAGGLDDLIGYRPPSVAPAPLPEQPSAWRRVPDVGVAALKGAVGLVETGIGIADIPTMGAVGRGLEKIGVRPREAHEVLSTWYSPQQQKAQTEVSGAFKEGFVPGVVSALRRPSTIATTVGESLPSMLAGGVAARGIKAATGVAPWLAGAAGEGIVGAGSAAEQIRQQSETGYLTPKQLAAIASSGAGTAALGALGGRLSEHFGVGDIETAMARGALREGAEGVPAKIPKSFLKRAAISGVTEGVFEELPQSVQEQMWQNYAVGKPVTEGLAEAAGMGALAGVGMGATVGALSRPRDLTKKVTPTEEVIRPSRDVSGMVPDIFTGEMRPPGNEYQAAMEDAVRQVAPEQVEMFAPRPIPTVGGAPLSFGGYGVAGKVVKPGRKVAGEAVAKAKKPSPIEEARARVDAAFPVGSPEHVDASNMLDTATSKTRGKALAAVNKMISSAQKGEPYAGQIEKPSKGVLRGKVAKPQVEVGLPGVGEGYAQPEAVTGEGKAQAKRAARKVKPVATEPIPEMPVLAEQLPEYEDNMRSYLSSGIGPINAMIVNRAFGTEEAGGVKTSMGALARDMKMSKQAVHKRYVKAMRELQANAEAAGVPWDRAQELLGIAPAPVDTALVGEGAFEGGARAVRAPGEEFEPEYGMAREEAVGEQGAIEEEAAPAEEEVSTEDVLNQEAEQLVTEAPLGVVTAAARIWNLMAQGLDIELTPLQQREYEQRMGSMQDIRNEQDAFAAIERIHASFMKKHKLGDYREQVRPEKVRGGREADKTGTQLPEGEGVVQEGEYAPVVGAKGTEGVKVATKKRRAIMRSEGKEPRGTGNTVSTITDNLRKVFFSPVKMDSVVSVVQNEDDLPDTTDMEEIKSARGGVQGFYDKKTKKAWLIANNIPVGQELSVMLHEVGVHMGMRNLLGPENYTKLTNQLKEWYRTGTGKEKELIDLAVGRVMAAQKAQQDEAVAEAVAEAKEAGVTLPEASIERIRRAAKLNNETATEEMLAYLVEEAVNAGISPTAMQGLSKEFQQWIKTLWLAVSRALRKLGIDIKSLTAQDVVDLAYGAAHMELQRGAEPATKEPVAAVTTKYKSEQSFGKAEQYIKKTGDYHTIRVEKQESGEVWATRIPAERPEKMFSMAPTAGMSNPKAVEWNEATIKTAIKNHAKDILNVGLDKVMFTEDLVDRAVRRGLTTAKEFGRLMAEKMATRDSIEQKVANIMSRAHDLPQADKDAASEFIRNSTAEQKWGYSPEWKKDAVVDQGMKSEFNKLSPMTQAVVKGVFTFGEETHARLQTAVNQDINNEFDELLKTAETPEAKADIEERRAAKIAQVGKIMPKLEGPYAPLKRFGNHVMVAMSKEYAEAKKSDDKAAMEKMQSDERHLLVEHFDTRAEAIARTDQLSGRAPAGGKQVNYYPGGSVETWVKQESFKHVSELPWAGIAKVKAAIEGLPEGSKHKNALQNMLTDLYLSMMSETSARKSELARKNIAGANKDMFRAFASQGSATAHFITSLENSGDVSRAITQMQTDAREGDAGTRSDRTAVLNELTSRFAQSLEYSQTPMVNRALKATSFWMLMTSPAFYVQNSLQPFMITVPYLAGRFGANRAWSEMTKAYKDIAKYTISAKSHQLDVTTLPNVTDKEKEMLKEMQKYGKLDLTIMQDIGRYTEGESVLDKGLFGTVMRKIWAGPQRVELLNRVASALAAYRLATGAEEQKLAYTGDVISKTHGNYSSFNAPRFFTSSGAMRLITQFRKFQLIQLTLLMKLTHEAFKGASVEERAVARRALYWLLGQHAVMTGALGLPVPAVVWAVAASLGSGDDEPEDYEQWLRNLIGDEDAANLLLRGVPAYFGLNMSQKVGMGSTFSALPFADIPKDRAGYEKFLTASLGASAGLGGQWFDALGKMGKGDYYKGVETALPSGLKNMMKGYRIATEGVTSNAGDTLMQPEDVSLVDAFAQGAGLPTMTISERQRKQGVVIESTKFYNERSSDLKRDYVKAYKSKDTEAMAEAREAWRQLQAARAAVGFRRQPLGDLIKAPMEQKKRERAAAKGIEYTTQTKSFVERLT